MSRIGKNPVAVPDGVTVELNGKDVKVKGKLGELSMRVHDEVGIAMEDGHVRVSALTRSKLSKTLWPTTRMLIHNLVVGVSKGYEKKLEIQGVGYRAQLQGKDLVLSLGFSHEVRYPVPEGISIEVEKQTQLTVKGIDKQRVGQTAAEIVAYRPPEPYKGKGVRYADQYVLRKEGKKK